MSVSFWISYGAVWAMLAILLVLVLLLYRQFGLTFMAPTQRIALQGLSLGTRAPQLALELPANGSTALPSRPGSDKVGRVVMFAQPNCAVCGELASSVDDLPAEWPALEWVWIEGGLRPEFESVPEQGWLVGWSANGAAHREWGVSAVPFGFLVSHDGRVLAKRLVNQRRDFVEMIAAADRVPSEVGA